MFLDFDGSRSEGLCGLVFVIQDLFSEEIVPDSFEDELLCVAVVDGVEDHRAREEHEHGGISVTQCLSLVVGGEQAVMSDDKSPFQVQEVIVGVSVTGFHLVFEDALLFIIKEMDIDGGVEVGRCGM